MLLSPQLAQMLAHAIELATKPMDAGVASPAERHEEFLKVHAWSAVMNNNLMIGAAARAAAAVTLQRWFSESVEVHKIVSVGEVAGRAESLSQDRI